MLGAFLLELPGAIQAAADGTGVSLSVTLVGVVLAAISGYAAIKIMIKAVTDKKLIYFSVYTWIAGIALILYGFFA